MAPKSPRVQRIADEFKEFIHEVIDNVYAEALALEVSQDTIYKWRNPNELLHMPAYALILSEYGDEIIDYIIEQRKERTAMHLNGSMDDEWAEMAVFFAMARKKFTQSEPYDPAIATALKKKLEQLLAEWKNLRGDDLPF